MSGIMSVLFRKISPQFMRQKEMVKSVSAVMCLSHSSDRSVRPLHVSSAKLTSAGEGFHRTSDFDKKILVWTKMYPNVEGVPEEVTNTKMKKAKDIFRIRVNIMMGLATVGLCLVYIWSGKRAVQRGDSIHQMNRDRHSEYQQKE